MKNEECFIMYEISHHNIMTPTQILRTFVLCDILMHLLMQSVNEKRIDKEICTLTSNL